MRAGVKIAQDMNAGPLEQMILETAENKFIIAPCGDLFLCIFTTADTRLGLIRVVLKSIQSETAIKSTSKCERIPKFRNLICN